MAKSKRKWMARAVKRPGALTRKAKRAGMTTTQYARHVLRKGSRASTRTKRQANLALIFKKYRKKKKKK